MTEGTIYNLLPQPKAEEVQKKELYRTPYYGQKVPLTGSTFGMHGTRMAVGRGLLDLKKSHFISSTFGPREDLKADPKSFLKKGSKPKRETKQFKSNRTNNDPKPAVPLKHDQPLMGLKSEKKFLTLNAVEAILSAPPGRAEGDSNYLEKKDYGKVPTYLSRVKSTIDRENSIIDEYVKTKLGYLAEVQEEFYIVDEEERSSMIRKLKEKWDAVNTKYQKICHRVNIQSFGDGKRKEAFESELQQLENDINLLCRNRNGPLVVKK